MLDIYSEIIELDISSRSEFLYELSSMLRGIMFTRVMYSGTIYDDLDNLLYAIEYDAQVFGIPSTIGIAHLTFDRIEVFNFIIHKID